MTLSAISNSDPLSSLIWTFDAVHGYIDIRDASGLDEPGTIAKLLSSPVLQRLRRIKQLGFASHSYPAADHSRHAHALGTMHMMRTLLKHLATVQSLSPQLFKDLSVGFSTVFAGREADDFENLVQHMLVAALLQDVGELPFNYATEHVFKPCYELRMSVENLVGFDISGWSNKDIFTVACIFDESILQVLSGLSLPFLVFLITGETRPDRNKRSLFQLRHMMDGVVDADRLDYVFRDAHHTVGAFGNPSAVIKSLLYYDEFGPVFSDPGPVSNFLATRAHLYSTVYLTPASRLRMLLLMILLKGIGQKEECAREFFDGSSEGELSIEDFMELDDIWLSSRLTAFASSTAKRRLDQRARNALEILVGEGPEYQCFWLPPREDVGHHPRELRLPDNLFFDTYTDQYRPLYEAGSVRIKAYRFNQFDSPMLLEECGGPFGAMFRGGWSVLPMPGSILIYKPKKTRGETWKQFQRALDQGWLYEMLMEKDPFGPIDFPTDTRNFRGFRGPSIFVSFSWLDVKAVRRIVNALNKRRSRYYLLLKPFQGIGKTASMNSAEAVEQADAVIILASRNYVMRYREAPDGYIAKEIFAMSRRITSGDGLRVVVLSLDGFQELENRLPWSQLGLDETPFVGKPLRHASDNEIEEAIGEALRVIDS